jgi:hypothetical protein
MNEFNSFETTIFTKNGSPYENSLPDMVGTNQRLNNLS